MDIFMPLSSSLRNSSSAGLTTSACVEVTQCGPSFTVLRRALPQKISFVAIVVPSEKYICVLSSRFRVGPVDACVLSVRDGGSASFVRLSNVGKFRVHVGIDGGRLSVRVGRHRSGWGGIGQGGTKLPLHLFSLAGHGRDESICLARSANRARMTTRTEHRIQL